MSRNRSKSRIFTATCAALAVCALAAGCGGAEGDTMDPGSANAASELTREEATAKLGSAPPELAALREDANRILEGGEDALSERVAALEGTPIVVNKWASWCGPCREEFPYFQSQAIERGSEVAFIGLLSNDGPDTGSTFLEELPLPYPSYLDSDQAIAESLGIGREFPVTLFYDSAGEVAHTKIGPYVSEDELAADIDRYAS